MPGDLLPSWVRQRDAAWVVLVAVLTFQVFVLCWQRPVTRVGARGPTMQVGGHSMRVDVLHADPCIRIIDEFLLPAEVEHLIHAYKRQLEHSTVSGDSILDEQSRSRTSSSAFLPPGHQDRVIGDIEARLLALTGLPLNRWETFQLTHYLSGQEYRPHFDWFDNSENNRALTVFIYLNDVPAHLGGSTEFTRLNLSVQPVKGRALIWYNCQAQGSAVVCDPQTEHAGRPPLRGEKYALNCWARTSPYR